VEGNDRLGVLRRLHDHLFERLAGKRGALDEMIQRVDISGMVPAVVERDSAR